MSLRKRKITASELRRRLLETYRHCWEQAAPSKDQYIETQSIWDQVLQNLRTTPDADFSTSVFKSLDQEGLVKNLPPEGQQPPLSRITKKGLDYLEELKDSRRTKRMALLGALTGTTALLFNAIELMIKLLR